MGARLTVSPGPPTPSTRRPPDARGSETCAGRRGVVANARHRDRFWARCWWAQNGPICVPLVIPPPSQEHAPDSAIRRHTRLEVRVTLGDRADRRPAREIRRSERPSSRQRSPSGSAESVDLRASARSNSAAPRRVKQAWRPTRYRDNPDNASTRAELSCRLSITAFWCSWISWRELSVARRPFLCPGNSETQT